jgi:hypothetical protein
MTKATHDLPQVEIPASRQPGGWEGQVKISDNFDAPLDPETQDAFERGELIVATATPEDAET